MLPCFILVRMEIVFLFLWKVRPFICASYPVCSHLPQVLWYCDYPNTIHALSCSSLLNPFWLWRHDPVSSILKHKQNPPWSPYSPPATDLLFVPWPPLEPLERVALTCFVSSHSLFIPLKFNFVTILPVKLLLSRSLVPFSNWKH